ncbi:cbb3-type cytochrome c oxidase subunit 3 [Aerophototrophica crusticola]|uniref:Cbb3-type cytochrome c oxidase subunit 3 n=1 Tax=Aerophototrophica crusticola TaxID=1709002 RepID=A0A858R5P1_9PROT|nr:cbb3-type cytochrome c oxidase subunit 3 [Rhodospirillaceae bacterium B3]
MIEFYVFLKQLWVVWFVLLFSGICIWAFWPSRRGLMEEMGNIPLRDGSPSAKAAR